MLLQDEATEWLVSAPSILGNMSVKVEHSQSGSNLKKGWELGLAAALKGHLSISKGRIEKAIMAVV